MTSIARLLATAALTLPLVAQAAHDEVVKPLKTVVGSVRFGKDLAALKLFAADDQGKYLLGADWDKGTAEQKKEFTQVFQTLFGKIAFPKVRKNFENLDSITYEEPKVDGDKAEVASLILINHPLKKQELKLKYQLTNHGGWRVVDVVVLGDSMLKGIKEDQIEPIMKEGGWPHLLDLMRQKAKELDGQAMK